MFGNPPIKLDHFRMVDKKPQAAPGQSIATLFLHPLSQPCKGGIHDNALARAGIALQHKNSTLATRMILTKSYDRADQFFLLFCQHTVGGKFKLGAVV